MQSLLAQKIGDVWSYCRKKGGPSRRCSDARTSKAVIAIMDAIKGAKSGGTDDILPSSGESTPVEAAPATPPVQETGGDALQAVRMLEEAWGESHVSSTACSSTTKDAFVPDSPISVASSGVAASPVHAPASAAHVPDQPVQVPGFTYFGGPAFLEYMGLSD